MQIKIRLLRRSQKELTECESILICRRLGLILFEVLIGFLSAGNAAILPSPKHPTLLK